MEWMLAAAVIIAVLCLAFVAAAFAVRAWIKGVKLMFRLLWWALVLGLIGAAVAVGAGAWWLGWLG